MKHALLDIATHKLSIGRDAAPRHGSSNAVIQGHSAQILTGQSVFRQTSLPLLAPMRLIMVKVCAGTRPEDEIPSERLGLQHRWGTRLNGKR